MTTEADVSPAAPGGRSVAPAAGAVPAGPLTGLRVVDVTTTMAGAVATMLLAHHGAEVTAVEPPAGHPLAGEAGFGVWAPGKTVVPANLRTTAGRSVVRALAATADVLLDDLPPGDLERFNLDPASLAAINPRLIHTSITACGAVGPWRDLPADESLVAALSGIMRRQPGFRDGPMYITLPLCSYAAALLSLHGIGAALLARDRAGQHGHASSPTIHPRTGSRVETSLLAGALAMSGATFVTTERPQPFDALTRLALGAMPLYRLYQTRDGRWLHLGAINARFWPRIALAVDRPELISDPRFQSPPRMADNDARRALIDILAAEFDRRPFAEWDRILDEHDVPYAPSQTVDEFLHDPQVRQQGMIVTVDDPALGPVEQIAPVLKFGVQRPPAAPASERGAPAPGTAAIDDSHSVSRPPRSGEQPTGAAPLAGFRVVDVSGYIAGPYGGAFLADLGADVIKVEGPDGDGLRGLHGGFLTWNRGKRGVCLDLRTTVGRDAYLRLVATADAIIENMRPGVADRLGVGYDAVRAVNPRIVYCYVSAYGSTGPYRHKPGVDPLMQARSGIERAQGGLEGPPVFLMPPVTDNTAAMLNATAVLFALHERERTGAGQLVECSLLTAACLLQSDSLTAYPGQPPRPANDRHHLGPHPLRRLYRCKDAGSRVRAAGDAAWLMLACRHERDWIALCRALRRPEWTRDSRFSSPRARADHGRELAELLAGRFAALPLDRAVSALRGRGVPCAPATGYCDTIDDPLLFENGYTASFAHAQLGEVRQTAGLTRVNGAPPATARTAPLLGEHGRAVLAEAGLTAAEIDTLFATGVATEPEAGNHGG